MGSGMLLGAVGALAHIAAGSQVHIASAKAAFDARSSNLAREEMLTHPLQQPVRRTGQNHSGWSACPHTHSVTTAPHGDRRMISALSQVALAPCLVSLSHSKTWSKVLPEHECTLFFPVPGARAGKPMPSCRQSWLWCMRHAHKASHAWHPRTPSCMPGAAPAQHRETQTPA